MTQQPTLAERFEGARPRLTGIAHRMLGSRTDAEDAVQEAWLRLTRSDADDIDNLDGWLTTVVSRVCLDQLRRRTTRSEQPLGDSPAPTPRLLPPPPDPHEQVVLADSVGAALLVVLETLGPAERLAFVLHDTFGVPFADIGEALGVTPEAARQHASRARRKVRGLDPDAVPDDGDTTRRRAVVAAFLAASRSGDFDALLDLLAPDAVVRADAVSVSMGSPGEVRGAQDVAGMFNGRAVAARPALIDGEPGAGWMAAGRLGGLFRFTVEDDLVVAIDLVCDPERIAGLDVQFLRQSGG